MTQQLESDLMQEFELELSKVLIFDISKLQLTPEDNQTLDIFFKKFLNPLEVFPAGSRHNTIEKNFAIYIVKNKIPLEQIQEAYKSKGFDIKSLTAQIKGVVNGTYKNPQINIGELVNWCKINRPDLVPMFQTKEPVLNQSPDKIKIYWDNELGEYTEKEIDWLIKGLIKRGTITVLAGKRSTLKSWLGITMGYCLALELDFLGKFEVVKARTLYFDRENGLSTLKQRARMIKKGLEVYGDSEIAFLSEVYLKIDNILDIKKLEEIIVQNEIKFLIVDTYRRVISFDENDAKQVSWLFIDLLKPLCERTGLTILLIHHEKKGEAQGDEMDMIRGSSDLANYVDGVIQLSRKGDTITIKQTKSRAGRELEPFNVKLETDETTFFKFNYLGQPQNTETKIQKLIVDWIIQGKKSSFTYSQALTFCESQGYKKSSIVSALKDLTLKGLLSKDASRHLSPYQVSKDLSLAVFNE